MARNQLASVRVPVGWHEDAKATEVDLVAPCGQALITLQGPLPLPTGVTNALDYATSQIAARGSRGGRASAPFPGVTLDSAPSVQVTFNSQDSAIYSVHSGHAFALETIAAATPCVSGLTTVLQAVAGSWRWTS